MINATSDTIEDNGVNFSQLSAIDSLLQTSTFDQDQRDHIESGVANLTAEEADGLIWKLYQNQLDPVAHRANYSQKDLNNNLKTRE